MISFSPEQLVNAIRSLFESNNYIVDGPLKIHGAEVDLRARSRTDPFAPPIYIEATIEHVGNDKYGKDATKFILIQNQEPQSTLLLVSSKGFSLPVEERALASRIKPLTYDALFRSFEQFDPYISSILNPPSTATEARSIQYLNSIYENPKFDDNYGIDSAVDFLTSWARDNSSPHKWIICVGEYGTGKTALTKVLLYRWLERYKSEPNSLLPIRIELRDFQRQFDARSLLHHFLDKNDLPHISVSFFESLINRGRVVLLLDGYDEMAQYMNARERRACLEALASLSGNGARGILTSRPNYFTEAEELNVAEVLYRSLTNRKIDASISSGLLEQEKNLDSFLDSHFINRYERRLRDLNEAQTESLVRRALVDNPESQAVVLSILNRVFRGEGASAKSLSGKPVIITYLLELATELTTSVDKVLTEWQAFKLISEKLMHRDFRRSPNLMPEDRSHFLSRLAIRFSQQKSHFIGEDDFVSLVADVFNGILRKFAGDSRKEELESLFADLRSSATLTRSGPDGWSFSHNSLREYFAAKQLVEYIQKGESPASLRGIAISDAMKQLVASQSSSDLMNLVSRIASSWPKGRDIRAMPYVNLLLDCIPILFGKQADPCRAFLDHVTARQLDLSGIDLRRVDLSTEQLPSDIRDADFSESNLVDISFAFAMLSSCKFSNSTIDSCSFRSADLSKADFSGSLLFDVDLTDAVIAGCDFSDCSSQIAIRVDGRSLDSEEAIGYCRWKGAVTDEVDAYWVLKNDERFSIAEKISKKLLEGGVRQRLGLTQRGAANVDPEFARHFLEFLEKGGFVEVAKGRPDQVEITPAGRSQLGILVERRVSPTIADFLSKRFSR